MAEKPVDRRDEQLAPDTASTYERAKPEKEAGMGRLDNNIATPTDEPDTVDEAVHNKQDPEHQINSDNTMTGQGHVARHGQPDHSMHEEEPLGWDQAPSDIHNPRHQRHPRTGGKGGTRDAGDNARGG